MSDMSISCECSEVVILDASAVTVVHQADAANVAHHMNRNKDRGNDRSASAAEGGVDHTNFNTPPKNDDDDGELPNLAKLVAATIRDRVVLEQMEEIRVLRAQLGASHRVEITGTNGTPVYARGCFSKGDFNSVSLQSIENPEDSADETGLFWDVGLEMVESSDSKTVSLNVLSNIEIRIGGILYVTTAEVEGTSMAFGIRPGNKFDLRGERDMTRSAVAEFNTEDNGAAGGRAALLTFHIRDFPRGHWRSLQSVAMLNRSIALRQQEREEQRDERREVRQVERRERIEMGEIVPDDVESDYESDADDEDDQEPLDVYNYLTLCLSKRHPGQQTDMTSVSLCVKSVRGRIDNLSRGEDFQTIKEKVFTKIDDIQQEELYGISLEEEFATLNDV